MIRFRPRIHGYTHAERASDAAVHLTGLVAAMLAVPILVALAVMWRGDAPALIGVSVYGAALLAMIGCSALYHMVRHPDWRGLFRRLDHSAIYIKIAGTYTPFTLLSGGAGAWFLTGLWGAALAGVMLWVLAPGRFRWAAFALYLAMGWAGVLAGWPLIDSLSPAVLVLICIGGGLYTLGTAFFLMESMPFHNTIWHVFVLTATCFLFAAVVLHLARTAPIGGIA